MFNIHPFHMAVMFLLNMELAYIMPPAGLNLFISSFRFNRPVISVYRVVIPFVILLHIGLILLIVFPKFSSFTVESTIAAKKAEAEKAGVSPREAWLLECVQMDKNNPRPCTAEDKAKWGEDGMSPPEQPGSPGGEEKPVELSHEEAEKQKKDNDDLFAQMMGDTTSSTGTGTEADAGPPDSTTTGGDAASTSSGGDAPAGSASAAPADSGAPSP
jgi:hypothetical protein